MDVLKAASVQATNCHQTYFEFKHPMNALNLYTQGSIVILVSPNLTAYQWVHANASIQFLWVGNQFHGSFSPKNYEKIRML